MDVVADFVHSSQGLEEKQTVDDVIKQQDWLKSIWTFQRSQSKAPRGLQLYASQLLAKGYMVIKKLGVVLSDTVFSTFNYKEGASSQDVLFKLEAV